MQMVKAAVTNTPEIKARDQWLHLSVMMGTAVSGQTAQSEWLLSFLGKPASQGRGFRASTCSLGPGLAHFPRLGKRRSIKS